MHPRMARAARANDFDMAMLDWWFIAPPSVVRLDLGTRTACALHARCTDSAAHSLHALHAHCTRTAHALRRRAPSVPSMTVLASTRVRSSGATRSYRRKGTTSGPTTFAMFLAPDALPPIH